MIHSLLTTVTRSKKRLGRGHGSGRGKTAGRGTKGQKARGTIPPHFEGGQLSVMKRLPFLRGKQRNKSLQTKPTTIATGLLSVFPAGSVVTMDLLKKKELIMEGVSKVKILSGGNLTVALTVSVPCSASAKKLIEKAGGKVA
ncbi:MAG: 50S ribosomal protein L15 [Patescibacteria group bacterium]